MAKDVEGVVKVTMRRGLGLAVTELRRRRKWDQTQLGKQIHRFGLLARLPVPTTVTVSRWETGSNMPSIANRHALAKIAEALDEDSLHEVFIAPKSAWRFLLAAGDIGIVISLETQAASSDDCARTGLTWEDSQ